MFKSYQIQHFIPLFFTLFSVYIVDAYFQDQIYNYVGLGTMILGLGLWWWGKLTLGDAFTTLPQAKILVQVGIYSKIRHPIYLGLITTLIGWTVLTLSLFLGGITVIVIIISAIRAHLEEKFLEQKFGKKYIQYKKKTWF